ncbi:MAG: MerR family transcriptional regulator [Pirellulales bacterium]|nr:MerR family transcriptional regulator [Pirellulales bacterium]
MSERWTIEQLARAVETILEAWCRPTQRSGRVRQVPDLRTIRYYTTLGLIDPPAEMRGRKALYGRRHLLQLMAIKRLQAEGYSLAEVQQCLVGAREQRLQELAALPRDIWEQLGSALEGEKTPRAEVPAEQAAGSKEPANVRRSSRDPFWAAAPALPVPETLDRRAPRSLPVGWALHIPVAEGVEVVLQGVGPDRLDSETRARLFAMIEKFAEAVRGLGLGSAPAGSEDRG